MSSQTQSYGSLVEPCKLSLFLSLFLATLPSLFLSLIIFSFLAFLLLLPLASIHLLSCIVSRLIFSGCEIIRTAPKTDPMGDQKAECIELDSSEIPRRDESESSSSSTDEQEKIMMELEELGQEEFRRLLERFGSVQSDGFMSVSFLGLTVLIC